MYKASYETYERALQRCGYRGIHRDSSLKQIAEEIELNLSEISDRNSVHHFYFRSDFVFKQGNYDAHKLLLMGFLLTCHESI